MPIRSTVPRLLRSLVLALVVFGFFRWLAFAVSSIAFPFGGGEFHAMFAYTDAGRLSAAVRAFSAQVGALCVAAAGLIVARYPLPWWAIAATTSAAGALYWWEVVSWEPQSHAFHTAVIALWAAVPACVFAVSALTARMLRRRPDPVGPERA